MKSMSRLVKNLRRLLGLLESNVGASISPKTGIQGLLISMFRFFSISNGLRVRLTALRFTEGAEVRREGTYDRKTVTGMAKSGDFYRNHLESK
jgi:hypothetical protein